MQKLAVFVVKALSKDNGADDVGCDALEEVGRIQGSSWRVRMQKRRQGYRTREIFGFSSISVKLSLPLTTQRTVTVVTTFAHMMHVRVWTLHSEMQAYFCLSPLSTVQNIGSYLYTQKGRHLHKATQLIMTGIRILGTSCRVSAVSLLLYYPGSELTANSHGQKWCIEGFRDSCVNLQTLHTSCPSARLPPFPL